jgi:hypothetical protein
MAPVVRRVSSIDGSRSLAPVAPSYFDAFEVRVDTPDVRTAEEWARGALEQAPTALRWVVLIAHRGVLRFRLGALGSPDHVLGWAIRRSQPDEIELTADGPLMRGVIVGRRTSPTATQIESLLYFHRQRTAHVIWALVGPIHRRIAPVLLRRAASVG